MSEHYITVIQKGSFATLIACRCGELLVASSDTKYITSAWNEHRNQSV